MDKELFITADGSHSIRVPELNECYHSHNGSWQEAEHNFIKNGILFYQNMFDKKAENIFEFGFGTGLNAFQTLVYACENKQHINYQTIEAYPVDLEIVKQLNYHQFVDIKYTEYFKQLHSCNWNENVQINKYFTLHKCHAKWPDIELNNNIQIVYFDAFAPSVQPKLWSVEVFKKIYENMQTPAVLTTYSSSAQIRKNIYKAGFWIDECRGAKGKKEMTRAIKI